MQTFLPYPSFEQSAQVLDRQRLGKQRVETLQVLRALSGQTAGWVNHPATIMWRGYEPALIAYGVAICDEWVTGRGYRDTCKDKILSFHNFFPGELVAPHWLGDDAFHLAHKSNLIRKAPDFYTPLFPGVPDDLPYIWPSPTIAS